MSKTKIRYFLYAIAVAAILETACDSDLLKPKNAPVVDRVTAESYEVDPGDTLRVQVNVGQPNGEFLRFEWSESGGQILQPSDSAGVLWVAPMTGGTYRVSVKVSNEHKSASWETIEVTVRSFVKPAVHIVTPPADGLSVVQYSLFTLEVRAIHSNGIHHVNFYINDHFQRQVSGHPDPAYSLAFEILDVGAVELKVEAVANVTGTAGTDSVTVNVEGIVLGKSCLAGR